jgi:hypothetical protein
MFTAVCTVAGRRVHEASASSLRQSMSCAGAVDWSKANRVVGRQATIKGRVAGTHYASSSNGSPTFVNLGVDYPNQRFQIVIWGRDRERFGTPERRYRGHTLCVRGSVHEYKGVPEIEASAPAQIVVVR